MICKNFKFLKFWNNLYMPHTFWICLVRFVNMNWIQQILLKIQSGHNSVHRWTDGWMDRRTSMQSFILFLKIAAMQSWLFSSSCLSVIISCFVFCCVVSINLPCKTITKANLYKQLTHCGREDLWKWTIFNTILTSPKVLAISRRFGCRLWTFIGAHGLLRVLTFNF